MKRRMILILLCAAMLTLPVHAAVMGEPIDGCSAQLAQGVTLTECGYWTGSDYRSEHYLTLAPGSVAVPVAAACDPLWERQSLNDAANALAQKGLRAVAGSNGGYYTLATGAPVGLVASGGVLRADDEGLYALGFRSDGSAVFGRAETQLTLRDGSDTVIPIAGLNHSVGRGLQLFTADCAEALQLTAESWLAVCTADGKPGFDRSVSLRVEELRTAEGSVTVPAGRLILLLQKTVDETEQSLPEAIAPGRTLTLECACAPGWEDVDSAVGILYPLVEDGAVCPGLEPGAGPRTAIGQKADGTLLLYTLDGRQSGHSVGASLSGVAKRMLELGCVWAGGLDGGGSTQLSACLPGEGGLQPVNRPSDGSARRVVNYILLAVPAQSVGPAASLALYPLHINAVSGTKVPLTVRAIDKYGNAAAVPGYLSYTVTGNVGRVVDGVFCAEGNGSGSIIVSAPGLTSATVPVRVCRAPEELVLYGEKYGKLTTSLTLEPGQEVDLTVRATDGHVLLTGADTLYTWTLDGAVGTVDETGHLIPGEDSGSGTLTASLGQRSVSIPITVRGALPFWDVGHSDPYYAAVKYVYDHGIFAGTGETTFDPDVVMNRAMLVTVLWRMCGQPEAEAPAGFADVAADSWYGPAVAWAAETGLVQGYSETAFAPTDDLTREQILTILHRWAGLPEAPETPEPLEDASEYALPALYWALERGLVDMDGETPLLPRGAMDRAAVAEALMRYELYAAPEND